MDDVQFFTAENLELRLKIKALVIQSTEQKMRITELNQLLADSRTNTSQAVA
jgi:uncharacterized coiled-coil protein SlyX